VKHLRSHWKKFVIVVLFSAMLGCQSLDGAPREGGNVNPLVVTSQQLDFGTVVVGSSKALNATVYNRSRSRITLSKATVTGNGFTVTSDLPVTVRPRRHIQITIRFAPQAVGKPAGTVVLSSSYPQPAPIVALAANSRLRMR